MTKPGAENETSFELMDPEERPNVYIKRRGCCITPIGFLILIVVWSILKATASGYSSGNITSLEKRFQLKSTEIGYISIVEDIVGLCTVMPIVHMSQSRHRPKVIGLLTLIVALGVFLKALPHFLYKLPSALLVGTPSESVSASTNGTADASICRIDSGPDDTYVCTAEEEASAGSLMHEAFWIPLGSAIISLGGGIGAIAITYLDDNVPKNTMPVYAAILLSVYTFGSIFGFFLASFCLKFPVTFPFYDPEYYSAEPGDAHWLGAWWMGYMICSFLLALFGIMFCFFPRQMRDPEELARKNEDFMKDNPIPESAKAKEREAEGEQKTVGVIASLKDFFISLSYVLRNVVVMCIILSGCLVAFTATVFMIFGPKFMSIVYELDPSMSALVMGAFLIPGAFVGQILGGVLIKKMRLTRYGMALMCIFTDAVMLLGFFFFYTIRCDKRAVAGLTVLDQSEPVYSAFNGTSPPILLDDNLIATCNENCGCPDGVYQPVCGSDGITYVTACHAGCREYDASTKSFSDCACVSGDGMAVPKQCERPCNAWIFYILFLVPSSFLGTMGGIAGFMLQLRSVDEAHRGLAMSFGNVLVRILGYIPGPVIIGGVIDLACLMYQKTCGKTGNCVIYDSDAFLFGFNTTILIPSLISTLFIFSACIIIRRQTPKGERGLRTIPNSDEAEA